MDQKAIEELREKYIKNPPEGMTANSGSSDHAFRYELIRFSGCN